MSVLLVADAQRVPELAGLDADALQLAIDDVEAEIVDRFGAYGAGAITETIQPTSSSSTIVLRRKPASITSVKEWTSIVALPDRTLVEADYQARGFLLERLRSGDNPASGWSLYGIEVVYVPVDDTARRKMATIDVLKLEFGFSGSGTLRIGDYSRSVASAAGNADQVTRDRTRILSRLRPKRMVLR